MAKITNHSNHSNVNYIGKIFSSSPLVILFILYFLICGFRIWISFAFAGPQYIPDETIYNSIAQSIVDGTFISSGAYASLVPPGYPLLLSISYLFGPDKIIIYHVQLILNALVASAVLFPAYFFLRDWCTKEIALCGSALITTLPAISKATGLVVSENLFIPLIVFAFYFIYKSFKTDSTSIALLAGFLSFFVFLTRSTGIALLIALVLGVIWYCCLCQKKEVPFVTTLRKKWGLLAGCFIPFALWTIFLIGTGKNVVGYGQDAMPMTYVQNLGVNLIQYIQIFILQIDYVLLTAYIVGVVVAMYAMYLILRQSSDITAVLKNNKNKNYEIEATALCGITGFSVPLIVFLALASLPLITNLVPYMYGRYYDPILPILFLFTMIGIQHLIAKKKIAKTHIYGIFVTSVVAAFLVTLTLGWNSHFDILVNASLPYLYLLPASIGTAIILILLGILFPAFLIMGSKSKLIMHAFLIVMLAMNIFISIPMFQTEIQFSNNFDNIGVIGKVIHYNIEPDAVIIWDNSSLDPFWNAIFYTLIDYWIENDLRSAHLTDIASSGDYSVLQDGDYIITALKGDTEPIYTSPSGLSMYHV